MQKENYLYFLTLCDKPCDKGLKQLLRYNLIPKIKKSKIGNLEIIKKEKRNKFHLTFICKKNERNKLIKKKLLEFFVKLREALKETPIKIINIAKNRKK